MLPLAGCGLDGEHSMVDGMRTGDRTRLTQDAHPAVIDTVDWMQARATSVACSLDGGSNLLAHHSRRRATRFVLGGTGCEQGAAADAITVNVEVELCTGNATCSHLPLCVSPPSPPSALTAFDAAPTRTSFCEFQPSPLHLCSCLFSSRASSLLCCPCPSASALAGIMAAPLGWVVIAIVCASMWGLGYSFLSPVTQVLKPAVLNTVYGALLFCGQSETHSQREKNDAQRPTRRTGRAAQGVGNALREVCAQLLFSPILVRFPVTSPVVLSYGLCVWCCAVSFLLCIWQDQILNFYEMGNQPKIALFVFLYAGLFISASSLQLVGYKLLGDSNSGMQCHTRAHSAHRSASPALAGWLLTLSRGTLLSVV